MGFNGSKDAALAGESSSKEKNEAEVTATDEHTKLKEAKEKADKKTADTKELMSKVGTEDKRFLRTTVDQLTANMVAIDAKLKALNEASIRTDFLRIGASMFVLIGEANDKLVSGDGPDAVELMVNFLQSVTSRLSPPKDANAQEAGEADGAPEETSAQDAAVADAMASMNRLFESSSSEPEVTTATTACKRDQKRAQPDGGHDEKQPNTKKPKPTDSAETGTLLDLSDGEVSDPFSGPYTPEKGKKQADLLNKKVQTNVSAKKKGKGKAKATD